MPLSNVNTAYDKMSVSELTEELALLKEALVQTIDLRETRPSSLVDTIAENTILKLHQRIKEVKLQISFKGVSIKNG